MCVQAFEQKKKTLCYSDCKTTVNATVGWFSSRDLGLINSKYTTHEAHVVKYHRSEEVPPFILETFREGVHNFGRFQTTA